jgi:DNA-binding NarL/FixJ family response regulator
MKNSAQHLNDEIRVLIVDDHPIFRMGMCERINSMGGQVVLVGEASDGISAYDLAAALHPHVILMDLIMPGISGIEATKNIKTDFPEIQIIILSSDDLIDDIKAALQVGASGYLLKSVSGLEMQEAIFTVLSGGSVLTPSVAREILATISNPSIAANILSEREIQILEKISGGATNKKIAKELFVSIRTVEAHVHNIFQKLDVSSRTEAVTQAIRDGLII